MKKKCETGGPLVVPESTAVKIIQPMHPQINVPSSTDMLLKKLISSTVPNGSFSSTTKSADKIYEKGDGGALDTVLPVVPAILGAINPALGAVAGIGVNMYQNSKAQDEAVPKQNTMVNSNPYGFELGGMLKGIEGIEQFVGDKHSDPSGGISVSPGGVPVSDSNQKVEDGETVFDVGGGRKYVFSAKLVI